MDWTDEERAIYGPYHNGAAKVFGDPDAIYRALVQACGGHYGQILKDIGAAYGEDDKPLAVLAPDQQLTFLKGRQALAEAAVPAFGLLPFDPATGKGCGEGYCYDLACHFLNWRDDLKKKAAGSPSSAPATASGPPAASLGTPTS